VPRYKVLRQGFYGGRRYSPDGPRDVLYAEKPFSKKGGKEQVPRWLERLPDETAKAQRAREAAEARRKAAADTKQAEDQTDIATMQEPNFGGSAGTVETL
jgi:hypothetical protein